MTQIEHEHETQPKKPLSMPRVKIIWFSEGDTTRIAESEISLYLADGWDIVGAGGGGLAPSGDGVGFIVLQK